MSGKEIARLDQQKFGKGKQSFVLFDDGTLRITLSKKENVQQHSASLTGWNPEPAHEKNDSKLSRIVFRGITVLLCGFFALCVVMMFATPAAIVPTLVVTVILGLAWWFLLNQRLAYNYDVLIFSNPTTGGQLVLHNNEPDEETFATFVTALQTIIKKYPFLPQGSTHTLVTELRELARLRDDGILTSEEFETEKRKLLSSLNAPSNIGFRP